MTQMGFLSYEYVNTQFVQMAKESMTFYGTKNAHLADLLTILIGNEANSTNIQKLLNIGLGRLSEMSCAELIEEASISEIAAQRIIASFGLAHQYIVSRPPKRDTITSPSDVADLMMAEMRFLTQEHFVCLFLNTRNQVIGKKTISIGGLDAAIVRPREVFKEAISRSAAYVICIHNHPSGNHNPSREDIGITERLVEAGQLIGIDLLDHIIIGDGSYCSLKEQGYI